MIDLTKARNYYVACSYTDIRLGIDGLAAVVSQQYGSHLDEESLFLFSSRRTDRIKALTGVVTGISFCIRNYPTEDSSGPGRKRSLDCWIR